MNRTIIDLCSSDDEEDDQKRVVGPAACTRRKTNAAASHKDIDDMEIDIDWDLTSPSLNDFVEIISPAKSVPVASKPPKNQSQHKSRTSQRKKSCSNPKNRIGKLKSDENDDNDNSSLLKNGIENHFDQLTMKRKLELDDASLAAELQAKEDELVRSHKKRKKQEEKKDASLAAKLQLKEEKELEEGKKHELEQMKQSSTGLAYLLVEQLIEITKEYTTKGIEPIARDDLVFTAERILECQKSFKKKHKPTYVTIGYHYTRNKNLKHIKQDGLLTIDDRKKQKHANIQNRAVFGNGIYTSNNPLGFR